jgi:hypothetical protein
MLLPLSVSFPISGLRVWMKRPYYKSDMFVRLVSYAFEALQVGSWFCVGGADQGACP